MNPFKGGNFLIRELNEAEGALIGFAPRSLSQQRNAAILNSAPVI